MIDTEAIQRAALDFLREHKGKWIPNPDIAAALPQFEENDVFVALTLLYGTNGVMHAAGKTMLTR